MMWPPSGVWSGGHCPQAGRGDRLQTVCKGIGGIGVADARKVDHGRIRPAIALKGNFPRHGKR